MTYHQEYIWQLDKLKIIEMYQSIDGSFFLPGFITNLYDEGHINEEDRDYLYFLSHKILVDKEE